MEGKGNKSSLPHPSTPIMQDKNHDELEKELQFSIHFSSTSPAREEEEDTNNQEFDLIEERVDIPPKHDMKWVNVKKMKRSASDRSQSFLSRSEITKVPDNLNPWQKISVPEGLNNPINNKILSTRKTECSSTLEIPTYKWKRPEIQTKASKPSLSLGDCRGLQHRSKQIINGEEDTLPTHRRVKSQENFEINETTRSNTDVNSYNPRNTLRKTLSTRIDPYLSVNKSQTPVFQTKLKENLQATNSIPIPASEEPKSKESTNLIPPKKKKKKKEIARYIRDKCIQKTHALDYFTTLKASSSNKNWIYDSRYSNCSMCKIQFKYNTQKVFLLFLIHSIFKELIQFLPQRYCRNCSEVTCIDCSANKIKLPHKNFTKKKVRVCTACFSRLKDSDLVGDYLQIHHTLANSYKIIILGPAGAGNAPIILPYFAQFF